MSHKCHTKIDLNQPMVYQIRIQGHLAPQWADWFDGLTVTSEANGDTLLAGELIDQAALYGVLKKVRDLGMPLLSVIYIRCDQVDTVEIQRQ